MDSFEKYLKEGKNINPAMAHYVSSLSMIKDVEPQIASAIVQELEDQRNNLKLIASENYSSMSVQSAMGNLLTDKYAEGCPYHRFYAGCDNIDKIEALACEKACELFGAEHAYVQPHSGADANLCAYWAILDHKVKNSSLDVFKIKHPEWKTVNDIPRKWWNVIRTTLHDQKLMGLDYYSGGHLTHGYRMNVSAQMFDCYSYGVEEDGLLDYDKIEEQAMKVKPLILLTGYSAYPRAINFKRMREIADKCGAVLMVDMAHFAGLVAGKVFTGEYNPIPYADIVTTTTHKTLRGCRGGMILCKEEFAESVDKGCPLVIGGPIPQMIAGKAIALTEALKPEFEDYARNVVSNSIALADYLEKYGAKVETGGTDNHLLLIDVSQYGLNGRQAEYALRECGITCNRNALPNDPNGAWYTSGLRIGTPAVTTLGMGNEEMNTIAYVITDILQNAKPTVLKSGKVSKNKATVVEYIKKKDKAWIQKLLREFPLYPDLDLDFLKKEFIIEE